jgi:hypothetical protein
MRFVKTIGRSTTAMSILLQLLFSAYLSLLVIWTNAQAAKVAWVQKLQLLIAPGKQPHSFMDPELLDATALLWGLLALVVFLGLRVLSRLQTQNYSCKCLLVSWLRSAFRWPICARCCTTSLLLQKRSLRCFALFSIHFRDGGCQNSGVFCFDRVILLCGLLLYWRLRAASDQDSLCFGQVTIWHSGNIQT